MTTAPNPTAEMDALLDQMVKMDAPDLHISAGSAPMMRHDGEHGADAGRQRAQCR